MGLVTGLLTLPLAPVRGVALIAEQLAREAERQLEGDMDVRHELADLQRDLAFGRVGEEEYAEREALLLASLHRVGSGRNG